MVMVPESGVKSTKFSSTLVGGAQLAAPLPAKPDVTVINRNPGGPIPARRVPMACWCHVWTLRDGPGRRGPSGRVRRRTRGGGGHPAVVECGPDGGRAHPAGAAGGRRTG